LILRCIAVVRDNDAIVFSPCIMEESFEHDPFFCNNQEDEYYDDFLQLEGLTCATGSAPYSTSSSNKKRKKESNLRKAPGAPKRFKSSYILFFMAHREEIKKELGAGTSVSIMQNTLSSSVAAPR
jgi:hypothetical protein